MMNNNVDPINSIECEKIGLKSTSYENYTNTSNNYDKTRIPVGIENIKKILNNLDLISYELLTLMGDRLLRKYNS